MPRLLIPLTVAVALAGCATAGPGSVPAASLPACAIESAPDGWRQVEAESLSLCVPASWSSNGSTRWSGNGGNIEWGTRGRRRQIASTTVLVRGSEPPTEADIRAQLDVRSVYRRTETIGDASAELWITEVQGRFLTGADWRTGGQLYMAGEAADAVAAERQLNIFRTVRNTDRREVAIGRGRRPVMITHRSGRPPRLSASRLRCP